MHGKAMAGFGKVLSLAVITFAQLAMAHSDDAEPSADTPPLWTTLTFEEAKAKSEQDQSILLVYATASWCPPCQHMERTTWRDPSVAQWFEENGIALKFDVDENPKLSKDLGVRAMPSFFAYRNGELFDKSMGARSAQDLITWLEDVKQGRSELDGLRERAGDRMDADGNVDILDRINIARALTEADEFQAALEEYLWLWDNMLEHNPSYIGVRVSFMIHDMARLAQRHEPARQAFRERRAAYFPSIQSGQATRDEIVDWIALASVVDDEESILQWFDSAKNDQASRHLLPYAEHKLSEQLVANERWADLALLYPDPVDTASQHLEPLRQAAAVDDDAELVQEAFEYNAQSARSKISVIHVAMLASGNDEAALKIAELLLEINNTPQSRQSLASTALRAKQVRPIHLQWLDEALEMGAHVRQLRREVAAALSDNT